MNASIYSRQNSRLTLILTLLLVFVTSSYYLALPPPSKAISTGLVISQVYGGGGNSGATYKSDFIEVFNRGNASVNVSGWSVQYASAAGTSWQVTTLSGSIAAGQYYLIQEAAGAGGTTNLPPPDATGNIAMSAKSAKVALVNTTTPLSGSCPSEATIVDLIGYGTSASCSEGPATTNLSNTTASIRNCAGCADTDSNSADFTISAPTPRNTATTVNACKAGCTTNLSGTGGANPSSVAPGGSSRLTVTVTPASNPASTGTTVTGDLTLIGGSPAQQFFDDGTNGDLTPSDNIFSYLTGIPANTATGTKSLLVNIADAQARTAIASIALNVQTSSSGCGRCGVERWSVKTGTDADAGLVNLASATTTTISALRSFPSQSSIPSNNRISPYETTAWVVNATLTKYKLEDDSDVHLVLQQGSDPAITLVAELACADCVGATSPFAVMIANARNQFNAHLTATTSFQTTNLPVVIKGVGMFDFPHGQTGAAPNQIELHPILDIVFCTYAVSSTSQYFPASGGDGSVSLAVPGGCNWSAGASASWIVFTGEEAGSGSSVITYTLRENFTGGARQATITVGDKTVTIIQDGGLDPSECDYSILPSVANFTGTGGAGTVTIAGASRCAWQATSNVNWITITSSGAGIGNGAVMYSVGANPGAVGRKGIITVAGKTFTVKQKGS